MRALVLFDDFDMMISSCAWKTLEHLSNLKLDIKVKLSCCCWVKNILKVMPSPSSYCCFVVKVLESFVGGYVDSMNCTEVHYKSQ